MLPYLMRVGRAFDCLLGAILLNCAENETISERCAIAQRAGEEWGCWACWLLSHLVQRNHCRLVLSGGPLPVLCALRAGVAMLGLSWAIAGLLHLVIRALI